MFRMAIILNRPFDFGDGEEMIRELEENHIKRYNIPIFGIIGKSIELLAPRVSEIQAGIGGELIFLFTPISISGGYCVGGGAADFTTVDNDTIESQFIYAAIGWTPFVLWEKVYPSIGLVYNSTSLKYNTGLETTNEVSNSFFGIYYDLSLQIKTGPYGFFFKFSYQSPFDNKDYKNFWSISGGVFYTFGYLGSKIK